MPQISSTIKPDLGKGKLFPPSSATYDKDDDSAKRKKRITEAIVSMISQVSGWLLFLFRQLCRICTGIRCLGLHGRGRALLRVLPLLLAGGLRAALRPAVDDVLPVLVHLELDDADL